MGITHYNDAAIFCHRRGLRGSLRLPRDGKDHQQNAHPEGQQKHRYRRDHAGGASGPALLVHRRQAIAAGAGDTAADRAARLLRGRAGQL
ncbi:hypothetical protein GCM10009673_11400 [Nesterenkonia sandarakina]